MKSALVLVPLMLPVVLAGCMSTTGNTAGSNSMSSSGPLSDYVVEPRVPARGWAGCTAEGGQFASDSNGRLICVAQ